MNTCVNVWYEGVKGHRRRDRWGKGVLADGKAARKTSCWKHIALSKMVAILLTRTAAITFYSVSITSPLAGPPSPENTVQGILSE